MANVRLEGKSLVVVFGDGTRYGGASVAPDESQASIAGKINNMVMGAAGKFASDTKKLGELDKINANAAASGVKKQLERANAAPAEERPKEPKKEPQPAAPRQREETRETSKLPERKPETREEPKSTKKSTPRPTINGQWIETQLRNSWQDDRKAQSAANMLQANSAFLGQYLWPKEDPKAPTKRGIGRTDTEKAATISVFNALWQIPKFQLYLSTQTRVYPEFKALEGYMTDPSNKGGRLGAGVDEAMIRAADMYIRFFLFGFIAHPEGSGKRYREELMQVPFARWRLENIESVRTYKPEKGIQPTEADKQEVLRLYINGHMDPTAVLAAALYIRRWNQEHPEKGRGKEQGSISVWKAPEPIPLTEERRPVEVRPPAQVQKERPVETSTAPPAKEITATSPTREGPAGKIIPASLAKNAKIGIIGDSITAGNENYGIPLLHILKSRYPAASVDLHGVQNEGTSLIRSRFGSDIMENNYNIVVIQGGVNDVVMPKIKMEDIRANIRDMIRTARGKGMSVVLLTITPWEGHPTSSAAAQRRTAELNDWMFSQAGEGVVVVDFSSMGEGSPPRLKKEYLRPFNPKDIDRMHPNKAGKDEMGRIIAEQAFGVSQSIGNKRAIIASAERQQTALEKFADENWKGLKTEIADNVMKGNPAGLITLARNLPKGYTSLEDALVLLKRYDIDRSVDKVFMEYMHGNEEFRDFCRSRREYTGIVTNEATTLSERTAPKDRQLIIKAMQEFINYSASRAGDKWYSRLNDDLRFLYQEVLKTSSEKLALTSMGDMRTLAAISVYSWRAAHKEERVGAWAAGIPGVKQPVAKPPEKGADEPQKDERPRVLKF